MTIEEAIKTIKTAISEVEWNYPMDYAVAFEKAIDALKNEDRFRWHDLRKDPNDLPEVDHRIYLAVHMNGYISYITGSLTQSYRDLKTLKFESDDYYTVQNCIAWREIEPFEEVEE